MWDEEITVSGYVCGTGFLSPAPAKQKRLICKVYPLPEYLSWHAQDRQNLVTSRDCSFQNSICFSGGICRKNPENRVFFGSPGPRQAFPLAVQAVLAGPRSGLEPECI